MLLVFKKPQSAQVTTRAMNIINLEEECHRVLESQQIKMNVIYMCYLNAACPPGHHHNGFMPTGAFGHNHLRLPVSANQETKECNE